MAWNIGAAQNGGWDIGASQNTPVSESNAPTADLQGPLLGPCGGPLMFKMFLYGSVFNCKSLFTGGRNDRRL